MFLKKLLPILIILVLLSSIIPVFAEGDIVIVLDPGHGGSDMGSAGKLNGKTIYEKDLNDIVTAHLYENLIQYDGVKVYLTRYDDSSISLKMRSATAGYLNADLMISLHMNALDNAAYWGGAEIFVHSGNYFPEGEKLTRAIGEDILKRFEQYGLKNNTVKERIIDDDDYYTYSNGAYADYYGIIRYATEAKVPAMIIEHGFITNQSDLTFLSKSENLKKLADETAAAVANHFNLEKGTGQKMTLISQTDELTIGDLPTTLTVGDEIPNLTASGGSGSGTIHFESNDSDVIRIKGDKLIAVGAGKANITAVRNTDGVYNAKKSDNYIRITVNNPATPTPTPTEPPTPTPTEAPTHPATQSAQVTPSTEVTTMPQTQTPAPTNAEVTTSVSTKKPSQASASSNNTEDTSDAFWTAVIICAGVLAAFLIVSIVLLIKSNKNNRRK